MTSRSRRNRLVGRPLTLVMVAITLVSVGTARADVVISMPPPPASAAADEVTAGTVAMSNYSSRQRPFNVRYRPPRRYSTQYAYASYSGYGYAPWWGFGGWRGWGGWPLGGRTTIRFLN